MTKQLLAPAQDRSSLEERAEKIAKDLGLAIRWQSPCLAFALYSSEYVRADVEMMLENGLADLGQEVERIQAQSDKLKDLIDLLESRKSDEKRVYFVSIQNRNNSDIAGAFVPLNARREFFIEKRIRIVFWLTQKEIVDLAHQAPDFWLYRHCSAEFIEAPKLEQILTHELETAWHETGEYENAEEKISLRESLLVEIPKNQETISIPANMLLTLGILNWRKGDFEKANEQLQEALTFAALIQDNWLEAECFNAIALLMSSMGRHEDAIKAYKQANRLAPGQIFAWNNLGNLCTKLGRYDEALVTFIKALECNPQDPIAWDGLGKVYQKIGYMDDAISAYRKSIKIMPSFANPWIGLGDAYANVDRNDDAIKAYQQASKLNRHYVMPWLNLGRLFYKQGRYREALRALQYAATLDPGNSTIWNKIGMTLLTDGALDAAADAFRKAIDLDHTYGWAYCNLSMVCAQQGKHQESIPHLLRSVELLKNSKDKAVSWNRLGDVYRQMNEYEKAVEAYEMADKLNQVKPVSEEMHSSTKINQIVEPQALPLSNALANEPVVQTPEPEIKVEEPNELVAPQVDMDAPELVVEKDEEDPKWIFVSDKVNALSAQSAEQIASSDGHNQPVPNLARKLQMAKTSTDKLAEAMSWNEKGNEYFKRGEFDAAISAYNQAVQLDPSLGWSYSNLAHIYVMQNQFAEAILLYQKSIDLLDTNKDKAICWNGLGNVYRCLNDYDNAVASYQKAAELDPDTAGMREGAVAGTGEQTPKNAGAWNELGDALLKSGSYKEAAIAFNKAIDMNPSLASAYGNLAMALVYQGKYEEAIPLYKTAIELLPVDKEKSVWLNRLGNAYRKMNDYDNAIHSFRDAIALSDEGTNLVTRVRFSLLSNCYTD